MKKLLILIILFTVSCETESVKNIEQKTIESDADTL